MVRRNCFLWLSLHFLWFPWKPFCVSIHFHAAGRSRSIRDQAPESRSIRHHARQSRSIRDRAQRSKSMRHPAHLSRCRMSPCSGVKVNTSTCSANKAKEPSWSALSGQGQYVLKGQCCQPLVVEEPEAMTFMLSIVFPYIFLHFVEIMCIFMHFQVLLFEYVPACLLADVNANRCKLLTESIWTIFSR